MKWTNIIIFFLIKTNGWKDIHWNFYFSVNLNKILCFIYIKKKILQNVYFKADLFSQTIIRKIYIQLICVTKTRNGKLVALGWKQPLQEKLDIFVRIAANWYNNNHVKLFLFLFGPVNLHSDSWILQLKKSESVNGLWVKKFFVKTVTSCIRQATFFKFKGKHTKC